jgi:hypothetical protein
LPHGRLSKACPVDDHRAMTTEKRVALEDGGHAVAALTDENGNIEITEYDSTSAFMTPARTPARRSLGDARYTAATMPRTTAHQKNRQLRKPMTKTQFVDCRNNLGPPRLKVARLLPLEDSSKS